jgi:hypothetical protein
MRTSQLLTIDGLAVSNKAKAGMALVNLRNLGIWPTLVGAEGGYNAAGDILTQTVDGFDLNNIWDEFQASVALLNANRQVVVDLLTFPVTNLIDRVAQVSTTNFEKASEYGEPRGARPSGAYFNLGYDFEWYDLSARFTWKFLAEAPSSQVTAINAMALEADNRLVFNKVMDALYNPANRVADINGQDVNVYALYNNDGTVPPTYKSNTFDGTHTHYLASGATAVVSGDLDDMYEHLRHHGYSAENGVTHVLFVNSSEAKLIRKFRVADGDTFDFIPATGQPAQFLDSTVILFGGTQPSSSYRGLNVIGKYGYMLVVEDDTFPPGYMALIGSGGAANLNNPVGLREHLNTSLRGLRLVKGPNPDYPLIDSFYQRGFGTGIRQRGGAVVMKITAGSYSAPTFA